MRGLGEGQVVYLTPRGRMVHLTTACSHVSGARAITKTVAQVRAMVSGEPRVCSECQGIAAMAARKAKARA